MKLLWIQYWRKFKLINYCFRGFAAQCPNLVMILVVYEQTVTVSLIKL